MLASVGALDADQAALIGGCGFEPDYPEALVDDDLRELGIDPREVEASGEAFVQKLTADATRKASTTRLRSTKKAQHSSLPPMRAKAPSETGPINEE